MMRRAPWAYALVMVLGMSTWGARCGSEPGEWEQVWSDEFNGEAGTLPDAAKWRFDVGTGENGWGNQQLEYDTNLPRNVSQDGEGHLAITARREDYEGSAYTSGRINTRGLFEHAEGRFEARIQLPVGQGIWPAFWLLGSDFGDVGWPRCGEIDIMEYRGQEPAVVHGTLHGPGYSGGSGVSRRHRLRGGEVFNDDFHIFALEWNEDRIRWSVDGELYGEVIPRDLGSKQWVFDHPFFILLNVAVGGHFLGPPDGTTVFPQTMLVDWVRVYALTR